MVLVKCKECGHGLSKKALSCPQCGSPIKKKMTFLQWVFVVLFAFVGILFLNKRHNPPDLSKYPVSNASYRTVSSATGCESKSSETKKSDIFKSNYEDHWLTWKGVVVLADSSSASLNIDGKGTQDLKVDFSNSNAGYNLKKGDVIKVKFIMEISGGCFLPYSGSNGIII